MIELDRAWLDRHTLPLPADGTDKNGRGRVLAAGGARLVPGALRLTAEAALRAGAGKVQMATVEAATIALGVAVPEAAVIGLPEDEAGNIAPAAAPALVAALGRCDAFVFGPGMGDRDSAALLVSAVLAEPSAERVTLLDAAAAACGGRCGGVLRRHAGRLVLTPHHGEMAELLDRDPAEVAADPAAAAAEGVARFGAVVVLKGSTTVIAAPDAPPLHFAGGGIGLATGGSGDVLAGVIGGLLARGVAPRVAAAWGVWLHGTAGRALANRHGPIGFLARELLAEINPLMRP